MQKRIGRKKAQRTQKGSGEEIWPQESLYDRESERIGEAASPCCKNSHSNPRFSLRINLCSELESVINCVGTVSRRRTMSTDHHQAEQQITAGAPEPVRCLACQCQLSPGSSVSPIVLICASCGRKIDQTNRGVGKFSAAKLWLTFRLVFTLALFSFGPSHFSHRRSLSNPYFYWPVLIAVLGWIWWRYRRDRADEL